jgi:ComF family protein
VRSAVWLAEGARRAVHLFKYEGWWRLADTMARAMRPILCAGTAAVLVPIPLGASRQRTRGYNQSAVLATALRRITGLPVAADALHRGRETTTQTALTPEARRANLAGAFRAAGPAPLHAMLVDDVFTTGATLAEAAAALLAAGAERVEGVTFARAPRPLADAVTTLLTGTSTEQGSGA